MATKLRNIRVDDETWEAAKVEAKRLGVTLTEVIVQHLIRFTGSSGDPHFGAGPRPTPRPVTHDYSVPPGVRGPVTTRPLRQSASSVPAIAHSPDDKVKVSDCPHPTSRRIGDGCGVCGATVKGGK